MDLPETLIIFTRFPEPGHVKTRLAPVLGEQGAALLQRDMTLHTLRTGRESALTDGVTLVLQYAGGDEEGIRSLYGYDIPCIPQAGRDLGERMRSAFLHAFERGAGQAALIGTDCPGITSRILRQAYHGLKDSDCVLGPALDGGYYLIALKRDHPGLFSSIPWGTDRVLERTLEVARRSGLKVALLTSLADVDRPEDMQAWEVARRVRACPMISVVIPALNEEALIGRTIEKAFEGSNVEVILADGGSKDACRELSARQGARIVTSPRGRACQMNRGAGAARGEILLFLHADTLLCEGYDNAVRLMLADPEISMGAFSLGFDRGSFSLDLIATGANLRSRILKLPYGDQAFFVRKSVFMAAGGFQDIPIMEDVAFVNAMKKKGRMGILKSRVTTSSRRFAAMDPLRTWVLNQLALAGFVLDMPLAELAELYRGKERSPGIWIQKVLSAMKNKLCR